MSSTDIPLSHLPLRSSTLDVFQKRGFSTVRELEDSKASGGMGNLAAELGVSLQEAGGLYREVTTCMNSNKNESNMTAMDMYEKQKEKELSIITFSREVDIMLKGGIHVGELTEMAGPPGIGKTQLGMQLAVNARLPTQYGGVAGEAIYIDSEGSFAPERCYTMAKALVSHIQAGKQRRQDPSPLPPWFTPESILQGIHVYRVHDEAAQTAVLYALPNLLQERQQAGSPIRLIVIDSMAFHYRAAPPDSDFVRRTRSLVSQAAHLAELAVKYELAVVCMNQMTTKLGGHLVPALGESWAHAVTTRLVLSKGNETVRSIQLVKSPELPVGSADYQITESGIRGVEYTDPNKRQKTNR